MAYDQIGNNVYSNIDDLPENQSITDGDKFIVQTDDGTVLVDFYNLKIDLEHTEFQNTFQEMIEFTGTATNLITELNNDITTLKDEFEEVKNTVTTANAYFEALIFIIRGILGSYDCTSTGNTVTGDGVQAKLGYKDVYSALSSEAREIVDSIIMDETYSAAFTDQMIDANGLYKFSEFSLAQIG